MKLLSTLMMAGALAFSAVAADQKPGPADAARIAEAVAPSLVRVEFTLQHDKGHEPYGSGWRDRCPSCGRYHISTTDDVIAEERPVEAAGFVMSPTTIVTTDPLMHPRFIKSIMVRSGDQLVPATPAAYAHNGNLLFLQTQTPLTSAKPLAFDASRAAPYFSITYFHANGTWSIGVESLSATVTVGEDGRRFTSAPRGSLIVDASGAPVGVCANDELPIDGSWKGSPDQWPRLDAQAHQRMLSEFEYASSRALPRVDLYFRSPRKDDRSRFRFSRSDSGSAATEWHGTGVLLNDRQILVLANLKPEVTARLERIRVQPAEGDAISATFEATLKDYGAFIAKLDQPLAGAAVLSKKDIRDYRHAMLLSAEVQVQGETRVAYYTHTRIPSFEIGWGRHIYPASAGVDEFLFSRDGELVSIPMSRRQKVTVQEEWRDDHDIPVPSTLIASVFDSLPSHIDPNNEPLTEEEENRIAWIGVELQGLDEELARINKVSDVTQDGATGALVTWVYEDSPTAAAGLQVGDILLRLHVEGHPKPLEIDGVDEGMFGSMGFPWDRLDEVPEEYFDQIPTPWPSVDNELNKKLTQLGFGTPYVADVVRDGAPLKLSFTVAQSPPHHNSTRKFKSEPLGITVRDVTYEVRRYLQRKTDDPGVIIAEVEPGGRAAVAGIKPYELVTHVNDQPVLNVAQFENAVTAGTGDDLRLSVRRMTRGRIVKIKIDTPAASPEPEPQAPANDGADDENADDE